jgi:gamma-glutamyltranspeptidase/glutathione hydrolase
MPKRVIYRLQVLSLLVLALVGAASPSSTLFADDLVRCRNGAVVCVSEPAGEVGLATLKRGGTAVDAAVATAFALAVTYPPAGNIGGGGYLLVVPTDAATSAVFDFREVAPAAATREMFVQKSGRTPHRRVGVPGTVRGLALAHDRFGKVAWRDLVSPAVKLAREGFALHPWLARDLNRILAASDRTQFAALHQAFGRADGRPWRPGDRLVQPQLADVLERIAEQGPDGFYTGPTAELIAAEMKRAGGLIATQDLAAYRPIERKPLRTTYRGHEILAVPPSSSGGTTLALELNILETFDLRSRGRFDAPTLHLVIECMRRAFRDRAEFLGDPATTSIPDKLLDKAYARKLAATIDPKRATPSGELAGDITISTESEQTTHLSVIDAAGAAVSLTYTLESAYGSRVVVTGGGFLLNDEMNDFNWLPGVTNTAGRIGTPPNDVAPGKRMLSSMCPVVVRRDGQTLLVTGSPGGRTIINTVLQMVVNVVDFDMDIRQAVDAPRLHHQWLPDEVRVEPTLSEHHAAAIEGLRAMGHPFAPRPARQGDAHSIWVDPAMRALVGAADGRIMGHAAGY